MIFLSEITPKALIKIKNGTGFLTLGTFTTICLFVKRGDGATIRTDNVLTGLDASSETVRISAA